MALARPDKPTPWPLETPQTPAGKKGAELHAAWVEQFARVEKVEADYAQVRARLKDAEEAIADARTDKASAEAEKAYAVAKTELDAPWQARLQGPISGARDAEAALRVHVTESLSELVSEPELGAAAEDARQAVVVTTETLVDAFATWREVARAHASLVKLADGLDTRAVPDPSPVADDVRRAAERMLASEASTPGIDLRHRLPAPTIDVAELAAQ
jgi:chromosome segregation ATPase